MSLLKSGRPTNRKQKIIQEVTNEKETIRLNVNLNKEFYKMIKLFALNNEYTVSELIIKSVSEYMSKNRRVLT